MTAAARGTAQRTGARRMTDECRNPGPDGATCIKTPNHHGRHGGIDATGDWRSWL